MFDRLIESSRQKQGRQTGRYLLATSLVYGIAVIAFSSLAIIGFTPALAEQFLLTTRFAQPPLPSGPPPKAIIYRPAPTSFRPPDVLPKTFAREIDLTNYQPPEISVPGGPPGSVTGLRHTDATADTGVPLPPPPPKSTPKIEPVAEAKPGPSKVSEGVLLGMAMKRVKPSYPAIAKQAHASGQVHVLVTIAEDGRVIDANVISGPALLRAAALDAARQWLFAPTTLSKVPVKVQGVLTFNFIL